MFRNKEGACGFIPQVLNYNPFALIKVDDETGDVIRQSLIISFRKSKICTIANRGGHKGGLTRKDIQKIINHCKGVRLVCV